MALSEFAGPKGHWLLGSLEQLRKENIRFYLNLQKEYGDRVAFRIGPVNMLLVADHETVSRIFVSEVSKFDKGGLIWHELDELWSQGIFLAEGASWKRKRRLYAPSFKPSAIAHYCTIMTELSQRMADRMTCGEVRNIKTDMVQLTADTISKCMLGKLPSETGIDLAKGLDEVTSAILDRYMHLPRLPHWLPAPRNLRVRKSVKFVHDFVLEILNEELKANELSETLLSSLIHGTDEDGTRLSRTELRDEITTVLVAGYETTALATTWAWYELTRNPAIYERLKMEVDTVLADRAFCIEDVKGLPYTRAVLQESLRLYPPAALLPRRVVGDFEIQGTKIPRGTTMMISPFVMHRNETYFPDPEAFRPDRWLGDLRKNLPRGQYIPFGDGPRICVGNSFGFAESMCILATFTQRLKMEQPEPYRREPRQRVTLGADGDFPMLIRKRSLRPESRQVDHLRKLVV